tara:strand:- start:11853 stop:12812 length:960 start_codon:yes stop_codon:yes gene_type:complete
MVLNESRKRVLVTGGAGFIGSHLIDKLLEQGHYVICVDNYFTGSKRNISHLEKDSNVEVIEQDITLPLDVEVDEIYNLACPASPKHYQFDPIQTTKTAVIGALNMLELARRLNAKIFQASTSEIYGDPEVHPQIEEYFGNVNSIGERACYDEGKRCAETLFFDFHRQHDVDIRVARIFNTYGPRMHHEDGRVVSNFIVQSLLDKPLSIYGNGKQTRSFCYVEDMVTGILKLMNSDKDIHSPVNLGNPKEFSILSLAKLVVSKTSTKSELVFKALPSDDPKRRKPDIEKAKSLLSWNPEISLDEGIAKTVDYFKKVSSDF